MRRAASTFYALIEITRFPLWMPYCCSCSCTLVPTVDDLEFAPQITFASPPEKNLILPRGWSFKTFFSVSPRLIEKVSFPFPLCFLSFNNSSPYDKLQESISFQLAFNCCLLHDAGRGTINQKKREIPLSPPPLTPKASY